MRRAAVEAGRNPADIEDHGLGAGRPAEIEALAAARREARGRCRSNAAAGLPAQVQDTRRRAAVRQDHDRALPTTGEHERAMTTTLDLDDLRTHIRRSQTATDVIHAGPANSCGSRSDAPSRNSATATYCRRHGSGSAFCRGWRRTRCDPTGARETPASFRRSRCPPDVRRRACTLPRSRAHRRDRAARDAAGRHLGEAGRDRHARVRHDPPAASLGPAVWRSRTSAEQCSVEEVKAGELQSGAAARLTAERRALAAQHHATTGAALPVLGADLQQPPDPLRPDVGHAGRGLFGPVVHGPLTTTLLIDFARDQNPGKQIASYATQARAPLFDTAPFELADGRRRRSGLRPLGRHARRHHRDERRGRAGLAALEASARASPHASST